MSQDEVAGQLGRSNMIPEHILKILSAGITDTGSVTNLQRALQDILGYDEHDIFEMDDKAFAAFQEKLEAKIDYYSGLIGTSSSRITDSLLTIAQSKQEYWDLGEDTQYVNTLLSMMNDDMLKAANILDESGNISESSLRSFINNIIKMIKDNKNNVNDAIRELFKLDTDTINPIEAKKFVDDYVNTIAKAMYGESVTKEQIDALRKSFGFETVESQYQDYTKKLYGSFGDDTVIELPESDKVVTKTFETSTRDAELSNWAQENDVSLEELEEIRQEGYSAKSSIDELNDALHDLREDTSSPVKNTSPISFTKSWRKLGRESDGDTAKEHEEAKAKLLELAEAGKLTTEAFEESSIAQTILKETGLSAEKATQKINELAENVKQLDAMRTGISSITSAYDEKKDSKQHIVSSSTLDSMYDTLGIEKWNKAN